MRLGSRIHELRVAKGISPGDLANRAGLREEGLSAFESGRDVPSCESLEKLAAALDVPRHQLFFADAQRVFTPRLMSRPTLQELLTQPTPSNVEKRKARPFLSLARSLARAVERVSRKSKMEVR